MMAPRWQGTEPLMGDRACLAHGAITPDRRAAHRSATDHQESAQAHPAEALVSGLAGSVQAGITQGQG